MKTEVMIGSSLGHNLGFALAAVLHFGDRDATQQTEWIKVVIIYIKVITITKRTTIVAPNLPNLGITLQKNRATVRCTAVHTWKQQVCTIPYTYLMSKVHILVVRRKGQTRRFGSGVPADNGKET